MLRLKRLLLDRFARPQRMPRAFSICLLGTLVYVATSVNGNEVDLVSFNTDVRPILSDKCFACHGFDAQTREADLRLDTAEGAHADHDGRRAIVPGDLSKSELWTRINSTDESEVMPPPESHKSMSAEEIAVIRKWIEQGATYQKHWAFEPPQGVALEKTSIGSDSIDALIQQRLTRDGLTLSAEAEKEVLIRRVAFSLTGLPPSIADTELYLNDPSPDAYEKMVERYLSSSHYGEEMARHWLDVARYADTHGMHLDNERQTWAYRDWVVSAFNRNLTFDQFTIEQLAGDLLPDATMDQQVATGFNRCNVTTSEGGSINDELLYRYAVDRASTTMQAWLGLTGGCAVCHDHKFDPISQKEFYAFYAFFNSAADPGFDGNALLTQPVLKLQSDEQGKQLAAFDAAIAQKQQEIDAAAANVVYVDPATVEPRPAITTSEVLWLDDDFPAGGKHREGPGTPPQFVTKADGQPIHAGERALKRKDAGLAQDIWDGATIPLTLPQDPKIFAHVWLDATDTPKSIMVQFFKDNWLHRAVWGDYNAIEWGAANTTERVHMGELPATGQWVRLELAADKVGLAAGDNLKGFALTQYGGTVYWDSVGVAGTTDPATDPSKSFLAWWKAVTGKDTPGLPGDLNQIAKDGPEKKPTPEQEAKLKQYYLQEVCVDTKAQFAPLMAERKRLQDERKKLDDSIPSTFVFKDLPNPRQSFVMMRGAYDKPGDKVEPAVPAVFPPLQKSDPNARATRLDLAKWLVAPENPLTARVAVNRFWQQFFGTGLVKTSYDFGSQGDAPSHPELLDHLAIEFRESGWDVKALVRRIVCSKTFRQSSRVSPELYRHDPENRLYARGPRFRLDGEQIRDNALSVSGLLNLQMGGKGVNPYQPDNIWEPVGFAGSNTRFYKRDAGPSLYRRSIYTFIKRTAPPPFMVNFDAPNREQFCTKREKSNTPLQALQLMNDVQHVEAARAVAQRMIETGGATFGDRLNFAYRLILARQPKPEELSILEGQLNTHLARYREDKDQATRLISAGETKPSSSLDPAELAAYTLVVNTLLNLDETVTRN